MTPKKYIYVKHRFGWYCSTCATIEWYDLQDTRNTGFQNHVQKSPECKKVIAKCDEQVVSPRSSQVQ